MTIASEIERIKTNIANTYNALGEKGATMPETLNSNNLADTVATVTGGGGDIVKRGNWIVPSEYLKVEQLVKDFGGSCNKESDAQTRDCLGVVFAKPLKSIKIMGYFGKIYFSDGYETPELYYGQYITHTFSDDIEEKWAVGVFRLSDIQTTINDIDYNKNIYTYVKYLVAKRVKLSNYIITDSMDTGIISNASTCENFDSMLMLNNCKIADKFDPRYFQNCEYVPPISQFKTDVPYGIGYVRDYGYRLPNLPYGTNLSTYTTSGTISIGETGSSYDNRLKELYIILPKTYNVTLGAGIILTKDNWQYIADNAPTVESKTLTIGDDNIYIAGGVNGPIIQTLISKGWTVN